MGISDNKYKVLKLYIRSLSLESPVTGRMPGQVNQPNIDIDINGQISRIADRRYEVAAHVLVTARVNGTLLFKIELTQAGLFFISPAGETQKETLLRRIFPQIIFPAVRSNIANAIIVAGYQPIVLDHILLENFFQNVPVTDKRELVPVLFPAMLPDPVVPEKLEPVMDAAEEQDFVPLPAAPKKRGSVLELMAVLGLIVCVLVWRADLQQWVNAALVQYSARPVPVQASPASTGLLTGSPKTLAQEAPAPMRPNPAAGLPVAQWEQVGSNWLAAQRADDFTVELLRTSDLSQLAGLVPLNEGQPLFLVKLAGQGNAEYVVLSGVYKNEDQATQDAKNLVGTRRVMRFRDYR